MLNCWFILRVDVLRQLRWFRVNCWTLPPPSPNIYSTFMETPPPPKVVNRWPERPWPSVWRRLWHTGLHHDEANLLFLLLHNILPLRGRLARFGVSDGANCRLCPGQLETATHFFCGCIRVADNWQQLLLALLPILGPIGDEDLLLLAWPPSPRDDDVTIAVALFVHQVWASRGDRRPPSFASFAATLRARPAFTPLW